MGALSRISFLHSLVLILEFASLSLTQKFKVRGEEPQSSSIIADGLRRSDFNASPPAKRTLDVTLLTNCGHFSVNDIFEWSVAYNIAPADVRDPEYHIVRERYVWPSAEEGVKASVRFSPPFKVNETTHEYIAHITAQFKMDVESVDGNDHIEFTLQWHENFGIDSSTLGDVKEQNASGKYIPAKGGQKILKGVKDFTWVYVAGDSNITDLHL